MPPHGHTPAITPLSHFVPSFGLAVRQTRTTPVLLPHFEWEEEVMESPTFAANLKIACEANSLPPLYWTQPRRKQINGA